MYAVELTFDDDPRRLDGRPAHRERLAALKAEGKAVLAGPWADESGALLVFDVATNAEIRAILDADPYYTGPGVTVSSVRAWAPVLR